MYLLLPIIDRTETTIFHICTGRVPETPSKRKLLIVILTNVEMVSKNMINYQLR